MKHGLVFSNLEDSKNKLKFLWLSCGDEDGLISISQGIHGYMKEKKIQHVWHVSRGGHNMPVK